MENIIESRRDRAIACNQIYQLPEFNDVMSCADGALGNQIKYANGIWTHALIPPLFYVPWITFDNVYSNDLRVAAEQDIVKAICSQLSVGYIINVLFLYFDLFNTSFKFFPRAPICLRLVIQHFQTRALVF